jgi:hypothetical protein
VVEVDLDLDPAAEVTAAFDRLCVSESRLEGG